MPTKRKVKSVAKIQLVLEGESLKYVDDESYRLKKEDRPLSRSRIIKKALAEAYKLQQEKKKNEG